MLNFISSFLVYFLEMLISYIFFSGIADKKVVIYKMYCYRHIAF